MLYRLIYLSSLVIAFLFVSHTEFSDEKSVLAHIEGKALNNLKQCSVSHAGVGMWSKSTDRLKIKIMMKRPDRWLGNLKQAVEAGRKKPGGISQEPLADGFKKFHRAYVIIEPDPETDACFLTGKVRLTGDFLDHIDLANNEYSVKIELKDGSLLGAQDFKLFRQASKGGDHEIIATYLGEKLGLLAPRTVKIGVIFNDGPANLMLLQEDLNSDFLQRSRKRDGPIIEPDEYNKIGKGRLKNFDVRYSFAQSANTTFENKGTNYKRAVLEAISHLNLGLLQHQDDMYKKGKCCVNSYADIFDNNFLAAGKAETFIELRKFDAFLSLIGGGHGLVPTNRKFYFDPMLKNLHPIVYDSNPNFRVDVDKYKRFVTTPAGRLVAKEIEGLNIDKVMHDLAKLGVSEENQKLVKTNLELILEFRLEETRKTAVANVLAEFTPIISIDTHFKSYNDGQFKTFLLANRSKNTIQTCDGALLSCKTGDFDIFSRTIAQKPLNKQESRIHFLGFFSRDKNQLTFQPPNGYRTLFHDGIKIRLYGEATLFIDEGNKILSFHNIAPDNTVIIYDSLIRNWTVHVNSAASPKSEERDGVDGDRIDKDGLTGCLSFVNSTFHNVRIQSTNAICEDAVNFFGSRGNIKMISVENAAFDAIDVDFSDLELENVQINSAGNDCLDFSGSKSNLREGALNSCGDKAISVGEESTINVTKIAVENSAIGIASKDSSMVQIESAIFKDVDICMNKYRKKVVYGPGEINLAYPEKIQCK